VVCHLCHSHFQAWVTIDGVKRNLSSRKYCLGCSPRGQHNTKVFLKESEPDNVIREAVANSTSIAGVLTRLRRATTGSNYTFVHRKVKELGLETAHWKGQSHGTSAAKRSPHPHTVLVERGTAGRGVVRYALSRIGVFPNACAICNMPSSWNGKPLVLRLDHINGVRDDHRPSNLRFLCPNCDSQTDTYCGRNKRNSLKGSPML
jgi:hypothetical protein